MSFLSSWKQHVHQTCVFLFWFSGFGFITNVVVNVTVVCQSSIQDTRLVRQLYEKKGFKKKWKFSFFFDKNNGMPMRKAKSWLLYRWLQKCQNSSTSIMHLWWNRLNFHFFLNPVSQLRNGTMLPAQFEIVSFSWHNIFARQPPLTSTLTHSFQNTLKHR